jgi:hypothetical protein
MQRLLNISWTVPSPARHALPRQHLHSLRKITVLGTIPKIMYDLWMQTPTIVLLKYCIWWMEVDLVWFRFMVFNATVNNISVRSWWSVLLVEETGEILSQVTEKLYHIMLYRTHLAWAGFKLTTLVVIDTVVIWYHEHSYLFIFRIISYSWRIWTE